MISGPGDKRPVVDPAEPGDFPAVSQRKNDIHAGVRIDKPALSWGAAIAVDPPKAADIGAQRFTGRVFPIGAESSHRRGRQRTVYALQIDHNVFPLPLQIFSHFYHMTIVTRFDACVPPEFLP